MEYTRISLGAQCFKHMSDIEVTSASDNLASTSYGRATMTTPRPSLPHNTRGKEQQRQKLPEINSIGEAYVELAKLGWEFANYLLLRMIYGALRGFWSLIKPRGPN